MSKKRDAKKYIIVELHVNKVQKQAKLIQSDSITLELQISDSIVKIMVTLKEGNAREKGMREASEDTVNVL